MPISNFRINELGNKTLHEKHDIGLQEAEGSRFIQAKVRDQLFIDHLLLKDLIDLDQHAVAESIVLLASNSGSYAKAPSFGSVTSGTSRKTDMLSNSLVKLGSKFKQIKKKFGSEGIVVVTNHVILDRWTDCKETISFLAQVLNKKKANQ